MTMMPIMPMTITMLMTVKLMMVPKMKLMTLPMPLLMTVMMTTMVPMTSAGYNEMTRRAQQGSHHPPSALNTLQLYSSATKSDALLFVLTNTKALSYKILLLFSNQLPIHYTAWNIQWVWVKILQQLHCTAVGTVKVLEDLWASGVF